MLQYILTWTMLLIKQDAHVSQLTKLQEFSRFFSKVLGIFKIISKGVSKSFGIRIYQKIYLPLPQSLKSAIPLSNQFQ